MSENKAPAFQFYPKDYLADSKVCELSLEEEGAYMRLLSHCWIEGSIPADPVRCARIVGKGCSVDTVKVVQLLFNGRSTDVQRLHHKRLDEEREKHQAKREAASLAGKKSGQRRRGGFENPDNSAVEPTNERSTDVQHPLNTAAAAAAAVNNIYMPDVGPDVVIPQKLNTPAVKRSVGDWFSHLNSKAPDKVPASNSVQMQHFWAEVNRIGPGKLEDAIAFSISNGYLRIIERPPKRDGPARGNSGRSRVSLEELKKGPVAQ